ncbi:hypothetical protein BAP_1698 [Bacillus sp. CN2]|nr:hypothetical protein BAP_1698 [Bacillus sp. CN2]
MFLLLLFLVWCVLFCVRALYLRLLLFLPETEGREWWGQEE